VEIVHATGLEGARHARGVVVVIDVLRSFTVSAYRLAGGALNASSSLRSRKRGGSAGKFPTRRSARRRTRSRLQESRSSNSPTQVAAAAYARQDAHPALDRRHSGHSAVKSDDASLRGVWRREPRRHNWPVKASDYGHARRIGRPSEDHACAKFIEACCVGSSIDLDPLLRPLRESERYRRVMAGECRLSRHRHRAVAGGRPLRLRDAAISMRTTSVTASFSPR